MTITVRKRLVPAPALLVFAVLAATSSALACIVGPDTTGSCTEAALDACLPGGGRFNGTVTFNCGGAPTITVTSTKTISANTTIDGGSLITISGGGTVGVFSVPAVPPFSCPVTFTVKNLTIADGNANDGGALTVTNSTFLGNVAAHFGGAISTSGGTVTR